MVQMLPTRLFTLSTVASWCATIRQKLALDAW